MANLYRMVLRGVISLIVLSVLNITGKTGSATAETPLSRSKIRVAWSAPAMTSGIPVWIAEEKGLFRKNGLKVDLKHISSSSLGVSALLAGEIDVVTGFGDPGAIMVALQGADVVTKIFLGQHPDRVRALLKAYLEALHVFHTNKGESLEIAQK
jgi:ABC-type nitrate/sulfonate/bicarbonate transport system substrate-binding protein